MNKVARTKNAYSSEHKRWLLQNKDRFTEYAEITKAFNEFFRIDKPISAIQQFLTKKMGVYLRTKKTTQHYSDEQETWLKENYSSYGTYGELAKDFNYTFGINREVVSIRKKCAKGLKLKGILSSSCYKNGVVGNQNTTIGTVRAAANGTTYIKVKDCNLEFYSGYCEPYWLPIQKKIWIDHYGEVPEGKMVTFLDCNKENLDISNLYCIDRKISAILAKNGWYSKDRDLTLTAIKWCELHYSLKNEAN